MPNTKKCSRGRGPVETNEGRDLLPGLYFILLQSEAVRITNVQVGGTDISGG